jgi:Protein of unknown function (DUF2934)
MSRLMEMACLLGYAIGVEVWPFAEGNYWETHPLKAPEREQRVGSYTSSRLAFVPIDLIGLWAGLVGKRSLGSSGNRYAGTYRCCSRYSCGDTYGFRWPMVESIEEKIRVRAHELWEAAGKPEGREHEFWYRAEQELKGRPHDATDEKSNTFLE